MLRNRGLSELRRFQFKVWARGDCWEWRGTQHRGYGKFRLGSPDNRVMEAHRYAYEVSKGPIPAGYEIDHLCRHPWCVRPSHLEAVLPHINNLRSDSLSAQRARQTHCKRGHPFSATNTRVACNGSRICRICERVRDQARR